MAKDSQINIRFDAETDAELEAAAKSLGVSKSALVRRLTEQFLADLKKRGGLSLGAEWVNELSAADARTKWGERKLEKPEGAERKVVAYPKDAGFPNESAMLNDGPADFTPSKGPVRYSAKGGCR